MTVAELLEASQRLGHLAKYALPGGGPPPENASLDIWVYVASELFPATLDRELRKVPADWQAYATFLVLAQSLKFADDHLSDAKRPKPEVWAQQIADVDAFLVHRQQTRASKLPYIEAYEAAQARRRLAEQRFVELDAQLAHLDGSQIHTRFNENVYAIDKLTAQSQDARELHASMSTRLASATESVEKLEQDLAVKRQRSTETLGHVDLLKLVAEGGVPKLQSQTEQLETELKSLQAEREHQENLLEDYKYTMHVFEELIPTLQKLLTVEKSVLQAREERSNLELTTLRPLKHKFTELTRQITAATGEIDRWRAQVATLQTEIESLNQQLVAEPETLPQRPSDANEERQIEAAQAQLTALQNRERELQVVLKSQRKWLRAMADVEKRGEELLAENDRIRQWMTDYTRE